MTSRISPPLKNCLVLSASFMFVYTAYLAIQNLQSSLNQEANLGVASLSVLYGTIIIFGTQAPTLINLIGAKKVLIIAWIIHITYTSSNFYPTWGTLIPTSGLMGAIAGPMWTSQGLFITAFGEEYAALQGLTTEEGLHSVLSKFNGIFFMFYEVTQVTGNLISSLVLSTGEGRNNSETDFSVCGANACPSSSPVNSSANETSTDNESSPNRHVIYMLLGIFLMFNVSGFLLTTFLLPKRKETRRTPPSFSCDNMSSCFKMAVSPKMIPLIPLFMAQAMAMGVLYADYTKAFITCSIGVEWVGFIMASYGLLCAFFAFAINYLAKWFGRITLFVAAILMDSSTLLIMLLWQPSRDSHIIIYFAVPCLSGISEGIIQAQFNTLVAQLFKKNMSSAFATYHTSKAASFTLTFVLSLFLCLRERLIVSLTLYGLGMVGYLWTEVRVKRGDWFADDPMKEEHDTKFVNEKISDEDVGNGDNISSSVSKQVQHDGHITTNGK